MQYMLNDVAAYYGVSVFIIKKLVDRLQIGQKIGKITVLRDVDFPTFEIGLRALGYRPTASLIDAEVAQSPSPGSEVS